MLLVDHLFEAIAPAADEQVPHAHHSRNQLEAPIVRLRQGRLERLELAARLEDDHGDRAIPKAAPMLNPSVSTENTLLGKGMAARVLPST